MNEDGFSLIEMIVAISLSSAIVLMGYNALNNGMKVYDRLSVTEQRAAHILAIRRLLRETVEQAHYFPINRGSRILVRPMIGSPTELILSAPLLDQSADHLSRVLIRFDAVSKTLELMETTETNDLHDPRLDQSSVEHTILNGISHLEFQYLDRVSDDQSRWVQSWTNRSDLPLAVKISFEFEDGRRDLSTDLIIEPKINGLNQCVFDPVSRSCRAS